MIKCLITLLSAALLLHSGIYSQIDTDLFIRQDGNEEWLKPKQNSQIETIGFIENGLKGVLELGPDNDLIIRSMDKDPFGFVHYRFQHNYKGIPVDGSEVMLHSRNQMVTSLNHTLKRINTGNPIAVLYPQDAINQALNDHKGEIYIWEDDGAEAMIKRIYKDNFATFYPEPGLVFIKTDKQFVLSYHLEVHSILPLSKTAYYIDAVSGMVIEKYELLHTANVEGIAETRYHGTRKIITDSLAPDHFILADSTRGGGVFTYNMKQGIFTSNAEIFSDSNNYWNNFNAAQDEVATDAHWATEMTYDYYLDKHGQSSFDGNSSALISYIHHGIDYNNAFWNGSWMTYGDGDSSVFTPLTGIDVVGHEITHGVTSKSSNLRYRNESGALNESFSDIFGAAVELFADSANFDWRVGESFAKQAGGIRDMMDTKRYNDPNTYHGAFWHFGTSDNGGVHTNSGVQNYWFYLLTDGDSGTNDNGDSYNIDGMGMDTSASIAYRNLIFYLGRDSDYDDARFGSMQAAEDIYGPCSEAVSMVADAWYAVGVGLPLSDFDLDLTSIGLPSNGCGLTDEEPLQVTVFNNSCGAKFLPGDRFPFFCMIDSGSVISDTLVLTDTFKLNESITYRFKNGVDLSTLGNHEIICWVNYVKDTVSINDTVFKNVEHRVKQNVDIGVDRINSPSTRCHLSEETITVRIRFYGCDSLPAGTAIPVFYSVNSTDTIVDTAIVSQTRTNNQTFNFSFKTAYNFDVFGDHSIKAWTAGINDSFTNNDSETKNVRKPNELTVGEWLVFQNPTVTGDSIIISSGSRSDALVSTIAKNSGFFGFLMTGGDVAGSSRPYSEIDSTNIWTRNGANSASLTLCINAEGHSELVIGFDLKQTYSPIHQILAGKDLPIASSLRVWADGNVISGTYNPQSNDSDSFATHIFNLDSLAGRKFDLRFESRNFSNYATDPSGAFGDNAYLDNIFIGPIQVGHSDITANNIRVYPNPGYDKIYIDGYSDDAEYLIIRDLTGRAVKMAILDTKLRRHSIEILDLPGTLYFLEIFQNGNKSVYPFIKQ